MTEATQPEPAKPQGWGEPFERVETWTGATIYAHLDGKRRKVGDFGHHKGEVGIQNEYAWADRIVACVNALAGIANPDKLGELLAAIEDRVFCLDCDGKPGDDTCSNCQGWGHDGSDLAIALEEFRGDAALAAIGALPAGDAP